ncbi:hypothetical protein HTZ84_01525 [Haloterrigena sp. SYSU A558-1]|uniref:Uncharacterized protein n=1 Tax=Haloterrigena gelatinilytica TaxID=2741724 RepID=A0A8J8KG69_9EURY|nr:hypothetical protein [Haloterrigena gelatinilytica]NUB93088.1 hypothetical protein [Haloterrigena gelatinilytica]NUC71002.1 hypothetical protein [Haloterrigena gelatinilytica]
MVGFRDRLLLLTGGATAIAIGAVLASSGLVDVGIGDRVSSGVVTGVSLLVLSLIAAGWYESQDQISDS